MRTDDTDRSWAMSCGSGRVAVRKLGAATATVGGNAASLPGSEMPAWAWTRGWLAALDELPHAPAVKISIPRYGFRRR
ncbi:MAG: hypothetical protein Tsb0020_26880 [Haliangiales bacterium]